MVSHGSSSPRRNLGRLGLPFAGNVASRASTWRPRPQSLLLEDRDLARDGARRGRTTRWGRRKSAARAGVDWPRVPEEIPMRRTPDPRGLAIALALAILALPQSAGAKKYQMSGSWFIRNGQVFIPLQFALSPTITHHSMGT